MRRIFTDKLKEALISVLPVSLLILVLSFLPGIALSGGEIRIFILSSLLLILGIALFNLGADLAMTPMGEYVGEGLAGTGKPSLLLSVCCLMGVLITIAEPDLTVLANQASAVIPPMKLILTVSFGVGAFLLLAVLKILMKRDLVPLLIYCYLGLFALTALLLEKGGGRFLSLAFDSGGVTTGPITVPFIMALGVGIAMTIGGKDAGENSFGLVSLCSVGPILAVLFLTIGTTGDIPYDTPDYTIPARFGEAFGSVAPAITLEVVRALALIAAFFFVLDFTVLKLPRHKLFRIVIGIAYTAVGLILFLSAVNIGYMPVGYRLGAGLAAGSRPFLVLVSFVIGMVTVLAEPAIHVLTKQVESVTNGTVTGRQMLAALSFGVGISLALSMLRILYGFSLLYYLIPGYLISLGLSFFVPKIYTAIAFDSGGVASGPLTSSFILPMAIGVCAAYQGTENVLSLAFGVVSMVAMTPLISIQSLGFRAVMNERIRHKMAMRRILSAEDEQIIYFE